MSKVVINDLRGSEVHPDTIRQVSHFQPVRFDLWNLMKSESPLWCDVLHGRHVWVKNKDDHSLGELVVFGGDEDTEAIHRVLREKGFVKAAFTHLLDRKHRVTLACLSEVLDAESEIAHTVALLATLVWDQPAFTQKPIKLDDLPQQIVDGEFLGLMAPPEGIEQNGGIFVNPITGEITCNTGSSFFKGNMSHEGAVWGKRDEALQNMNLITAVVEDRAEAMAYA